MMTTQAMMEKNVMNYNKSYQLGRKFVPTINQKEKEKEKESSSFNDMEGIFYKVNETFQKRQQENSSLEEEARNKKLELDYTIKQTEEIANSNAKTSAAVLMATKSITKLREDTTASENENSRIIEKDVAEYKLQCEESKLMIECFDSNLIARKAESDLVDFEEELIQLRECRETLFNMLQSVKEELNRSIAENNEHKDYSNVLNEQQRSLDKELIMNKELIEELEKGRLQLIAELNFEKEEGTKIQTELIHIIAINDEATSQCQLLSLEVSQLSELLLMLNEDIRCQYWNYDAEKYDYQCKVGTKNLEIARLRTLFLEKENLISNMKIKRENLIDQCKKMEEKVVDLEEKREKCNGHCNLADAKLSELQTELMKCEVDHALAVDESAATRQANEQYYVETCESMRQLREAHIILPSVQQEYQTSCDRLQSKVMDMKHKVALSLDDINEMEEQQELIIKQQTISDEQIMKQNKSLSDKQHAYLMKKTRVDKLKNQLQYQEMNLKRIQEILDLKDIMEGKLSDNVLDSQRQKTLLSEMEKKALQLSETDRGLQTDILALMKTIDQLSSLMTQDNNLSNDEATRMELEIETSAKLIRTEEDKKFLETKNKIAEFRLQIAKGYSIHNESCQSKELVNNELSRKVEEKKLELEILKKSIEDAKLDAKPEAKKKLDDQIESMKFNINEEVTNRKLSNHEGMDRMNGSMASQEAPLIEPTKNRQNLFTRQKRKDETSMEFQWQQVAKKPVATKKSNTVGIADDASISNTSLCFDDSLFDYKLITSSSSNLKEPIQQVPTKPTANPFHSKRNSDTPLMNTALHPAPHHVGANRMSYPSKKVDLRSESFIMKTPMNRIPSSKVIPNATEKTVVINPSSKLRGDQRIVSKMDKVSPGDWFLEDDQSL